MCGIFGRTYPNSPSGEAADGALHGRDRLRQRSADDSCLQVIRLRTSTQAIRHACRTTLRDCAGCCACASGRFGRSELRALIGQLVPESRVALVLCMHGLQEIPGWVWSAGARTDGVRPRFSCRRKGADGSGFRVSEVRHDIVICHRHKRVEPEAHYRLCSHRPFRHVATWVVPESVITMLAGSRPDFIGESAA
jgi:hypothetical protein